MHRVIVAVLITGVSSILGCASDPSTTPGPQTSCVAYQDYLHHVSSLNIPAGKVRVSEGYAYALASGSVLQVVDIGNPENLRSVSSLSIEGTELSVSGGYAYVLNMTNGLHVIDVKDPITPLDVGFVDTRGQGQVIGSDENVLYIGDSSGLTVIDVSDPTTPQAMGTVDVVGGSWNDLEANGSLVFLLSKDDPRGEPASLQAIDASDPLNPQVVGSVDVGGGHSLALSDSHAYVVTSGGLEVFDVRAPDNLIRVGRLEVVTVGRGIALLENHAFLGGYGLQAVDISIPTRPMIVGEVGVAGNGASDVALQEEHAFVVSSAGLHSIDMGNPKSPKAFASLLEGDCVLIENISAESHVYLQGQCGFKVINIVDGTPVIVGSVDGSFADIHVEEPYVYALESGGVLTIIDVLVPSDPVGVGRLEVGLGGDVAASGSAAIIAGDSLVFIDTSDKRAPGIVGGLRTPRTPVATAISGTYAYVVEIDSDDLLDGALQVIDMANISNPQVVGSVALTGFSVSGGLTDIHVDEGYAYIQVPVGLRIVDISQPSAPQTVGAFDTPRPATGLAVSGSSAYIANGLSVEVVDFGNPMLPVTLGSIKMPFQAIDVAVAGGYAYVGNRGYGMTIVPVQCE